MLNRMANKSMSSRNRPTNRQSTEKAPADLCQSKRGFRRRCRATGITAGEDSPAGRLLQGELGLHFWELACKRIVTGHSHHRRRRFAGRPAPTGVKCFVFMGACLQANRAALQSSPQAKIRQQAFLLQGQGQLAEIQHFNAHNAASSANIKNYASAHF